MSDERSPGQPRNISLPSRQPRSAASSGERRVITALFCDVVDSTAMAEQLDPEDWAEIMSEAFQHLTAPITRYEGTVARLMGDAVLAFFGAPLSHEDDPRRAVLAGLDIVEGIQPFRDEIKQGYGLDFNVRVGINTGPVVVGDIGSAAVTEYTAMGDAVNVAARMEQTTQPGTVRISADTARLVEGAFEVESLGGVEVKGKRAPVGAFRVLRAVDGAGHGRGIPGMSAPLIGRDKEFDRLKDVLDGLKDGRGQIVCLMGEAGLGKSRLIDEVRREWLKTNSPRSWNSAEGIPYDASRPYGLFQHLAYEVYGIGLDDSAEAIHAKVETGLREAGAPDEAVALCSVAIERVIAAKVLHDAPDFPAEVIRQDLFDTSYPAWLRAASERPLVLAFDDLQWVDPPSLDLLIHLLGLVEEVPVLFLCAFRPERQSPAWQVKQRAETDFPHRYTEIVLQPLDADGASQLMSALLNIADLPSELRDVILRKTEGNPYFVEEVIRSLIERGAVYRTEAGLQWHGGPDPDDIEIPDTLQALLMARMDRLDAGARATLQLASVIGRSFYLRVLKAISNSAMALDKNLSSLEKVEFIREQVRRPELQYIFKHELARDAAYNTILRRRRQELHRQVAEAIETVFVDKLEENAHRLAYHFEEAGEYERAAKYYAMAAESAEGVYANAEAVEQYAHAINAATLAGAATQEIAMLEGKRAHVAELVGQAR